MHLSLSASLNAKNDSSTEYHASHQPTEIYSVQIGSVTEGVKVAFAKFGANAAPRFHIADEQACATLLPPNSYQLILTSLLFLATQNLIPRRDKLFENKRKVSTFVQLRLTNVAKRTRYKEAMKVWEEERTAAKASNKKYTRPRQTQEKLAKPMPRPKPDTAVEHQLTSTMWLN
jgi:hypothetical protein